VPSHAASIGHAAFGGIARVNAMLFRALGSNPRDAVGLFVALLAAGMILVNALYMQPGPHPAPIFSVKPRPVAEPTPRVVAVPRAAPAKVEPAPRLAAPRDPIAELIAPAPRVTAVQRALNDYGYGPLKATGIYGPETVAAIEKFERDRKLPVTGQISPRLLRELAALTGKPLE
jgi:putative peptidoglycan binding protein